MKIHKTPLWAFWPAGAILLLGFLASLVGHSIGKEFADLDNPDMALRWAKDFAVIGIAIGGVFFATDRMYHSKYNATNSITQSAWQASDEAYIEWKAAIAEYQMATRATAIYLSELESFDYNEAQRINELSKYVLSSSSQWRSLSHKVYHAHTALLFRTKIFGSDMEDRTLSLKNDFYNHSITLPDLEKTFKGTDRSVIIFENVSQLVQSREDEFSKIIWDSVRKYEEYYTRMRDAALQAS